MVNKISHYFGFFMVAVYLAIGLLFLLTDIAENLFPNYRKEIGLVMIAYSIYRGYMIYRKIVKGTSKN